MNDMNEKKQEEVYMSRAVRATLRISFIALLFILSFWILKPFIGLVLWGIIFAVGVFPLHKKFSKILGQREKLSAVLITLMGAAIILVPAILFASSTAESIGKFAEAVDKGTLTVPPPNAKVADWPLIGKSTNNLWTSASKSLEEVLVQFQPQIKAFIPKLTSMVTGLVGGVLAFIISLMIGGALMLVAEPGKKTADKVFHLLVGEKGDEFTGLAAATIRSVVQGVIGIALIQAIFLGIGMFVIDLPAAGIVSAIVLIIAIIQLPPILVMLPVIIYVFSYAGTTPAIIFTVWSIFWGAADTFLKPIFLGKGVAIPMLVILLGAIGGMILGGPVGLFFGSVVLALAYKIFQAMLEND